MADVEDIDLTLNGLMLPDGVKHDFGSTPSGAAGAGKDGVRQGIGTEDLARDIMLPFANQRPIDVGKSCGTTAVECNRTIRFTNKTTILLAIGCATFDGCALTFIGAGSADANVKLRNTETTLLTVKSGDDAALIWKGGGWRVPTEIDARKSADDALQQNYVKNTGGEITGALAVKGGITGNLDGTASVASKLGTATKGGATCPIYLDVGVPTECNSYPAVGNGTVTIKQKGVPKGSFTMNQSDNKTIDLTDDMMTVDSALSSSSTNPVQNKVVNSALAGKAAVSHGIHVLYSTSAPKMDGTAAVGKAETVARSDHVHPTDTSRAAYSHTHTKAQITDFPAALKNPNSLTIQKNGSALASYDGSAAKTVNLANMAAATASAAGEAGLVPAPAAGAQAKFLRGDGTWQTPTNTWTANNKSAAGYVAAGGSNANKVWKTDAGGNPAWRDDANTVYTHPTASGSKHIPAGGSSGQILRWSGDGTAAWGADSNTTYSLATTSTAGLMSADDKTKLNGISAGANKVTFSLSGNDMTITVG